MLHNIFVTFLTTVSVDANSVDADQTAPIGAVVFGSTMFGQGATTIFIKRQKQTTFVVIGVSMNHMCLNISSSCAIGWSVLCDCGVS